MEQIRNNLGQIIEEIMGDRNQTDFGKVVGATQSQILKYINGSEFPSLPILIRIAKEGKMSAEELWERATGEVFEGDLPMMDINPVVTDVDEDNLKITAIEYGFWHGRLFAVAIEAEGVSNFQAVKETLVTKYGAGYQSNPYIDTYLWDDKSTVIYLEYMEHHKTMYLILTSEVVQADIDACKKKKAAEGAEKDL